MGCLNNFCGGNSMWWILILLLILDNGSDECNTCNSLVWILLLSRFCGNEDSGSCGCGCGCGTTPPASRCGCGCGM